MKEMKQSKGLLGMMKKATVELKILNKSDETVHNSSYEDTNSSVVNVTQKPGASLGFENKFK